MGVIKGKIKVENIVDFMREEDGIGVVEIILILVVLIMLVVLFRTHIVEIVSTAFENIDGGADDINSDLEAE